MSEWKDAAREDDFPGKRIEEERNGLPADAEEHAPRRRRRADRYAEEKAPEGENRDIREFSPGSGSETAREVANRYRQRQAPVRPAMEDGGQVSARNGRMVRDSTRVSMQNGRMAGDNTRVPAQNGRNVVDGSRIPVQNGRAMGAGTAPERVGYPSGRMGVNSAQRARMSEAGRARLAEETRGRGQGAEDRFDGVGKQQARDARENQDPRFAGRLGGTAPRGAEMPRRRHTILTAMIILLLAAGLVLIGLLALPEDSFAGSLRRQMAGMLPGAKETPHAALTFTLTAQDRQEAPAELAFSLTAEKGVEDVRLLTAEGDILPADPLVETGDKENRWEIVWYAEQPYSGEIRLQTLYEGEWIPSALSVPVEVLAGETKTEDAGLPVAFVTEVPTASPAPTATQVPATEPVPEKTEDFADEEAEGVGENEPAGEADPDDPAPQAIIIESVEPAEEMTEAEDPETAAAQTEETEKAAEPASSVIAVSDASEAAESEAEETVRQLMTVVAAESADPSLIATTQIYNGTKKVKEYARADKEKIHMPTLGEYTRQKMGVLTFRGDAFRQNASLGTAKGLNSMNLAWEAEAGFIKGSGQTYFGIGWVGQPAIVKWSKQVREQSEMYDAKKEVSGLKEVIVGGLDGRIYFLDLSDGSATRNSVKLGFPMKGSPSVHPGGAPYMNIGQFARKMAGTTGKIGLRQYNLYRLKELSLIDGLDEKNNRPLNKIGSFETSALIDRTTGTMVTAGTNGLLYVISLNSEFDYNAGTYTQSPTQVILRTKAKGEKETATAVEASVAMYDRYVYYADMGGFLRCVDTNTMTVSWAVSLGDAVESTPALDWHGNSGLDLYAATELAARKRGDAEIKCFDALSGEERWNYAVGVKKDTKNKTVSGFRASPVVGQESLSGYVYYTVNNLSDAGQEQLGVGQASAALIALRKEDGSLAWAAGLSGRGYSSPVAVYDENGNGVLIQCAGDGSIVMLDGETGEERASLQIDGTIEASPAVYDGMMVIGTTERNKNKIYGIRIE